MVRDQALVAGRKMREPLCAIPAAFAMSCLVATLATDLAYWRTADVMWGDFSAWLVTVGVIAGYVAILTAVIEALTRRRYRRWASGLATIGYIVALIVATLNMLVHTRDAWTSVVPWGLILSGLVVLILLVSSLMRRAARERYEVRSVEVIT